MTTLFEFFFGKNPEPASRQCKCDTCGCVFLSKLNDDNECFVCFCHRVETITKYRETIMVNGLEIAKMFHDTYERLAPSFGYETRKDTKDFDPESPNGKLMTAVCQEVGDIICERAYVYYGVVTDRE